LIFTDLTTSGQHPS